MKSERVLISLSARDLKNVAGAFKGTSDPFAVVTLLGAATPNGVPQESGKVLGKTEVLKNTLNPIWTKTISTTFSFGRPMYLNVGVWDEVTKSNKNKPMGSASFEIGDVLGSRGNIKAKQLKHGGTLFMRVTRDNTNRTLYVSSVIGRKLANVEGGLFGKSDPFFEIATQQDGPGGMHWHTVYRSTHIKDTLDPQWDAFQLDMDNFPSETDGKACPIKVTIYDHERSGKHEFMGAFETTVGAIVGQGATFTVRSKKNKPKGTIEFKFAEIRDDGAGAEAAAHHAPNGAPYPATTGVAPYPTSGVVAPSLKRRPTFVDYVSGSCELNMCVAIDFTGSNGDPRRPGTLHYIHPDHSLNDYEKALTAIGEIVAKYDSDQKYPVYGFGAKFYGQLYHCFQCGGGGEVSGVSGILQAYRRTFSDAIVLSGPTLFQEVIQTAAAKAMSAQEEAKRKGKQAYTVLLILTDGAVSDVNATRNALMAASQAPLSVVIVGVGSADFSAMQFLDDFRSPPPASDIVQFVEFRKHVFDRRSLTEATLEEIPDQLVRYFTSRNIYPTPMISTSKIHVEPEPYNEEVDIDLSLDFKNDNEVEIDMSGAPGVYDYTTYGTASQYIKPPPTAPPMPTAPPAAVAPKPMSPPAAVAPMPTATAPHSNAADIPMAMPVHQPQSVFRVQVPPGVHGGQQLKVQNPHTGQIVMVTVPPGIAPGAVFDVRS